MELNGEEKEDYSLLDEKRKAQIIQELKEEIEKQKLININLENNILSNNSLEEEISKEQNEINNNMNKLNLNEINPFNEENFENINNNLNKMTKNNLNIFSEDYKDDETNSIFNQINEFIIKSNKNINHNDITNKNNNDLLFSVNINNEPMINENEELPFPHPQMMELLDMKKQIINTDNNDLNNNLVQEDKNEIKPIINNINYLNQINNKKKLLFSNNIVNHYDKYKDNKNIIKKKNSFNIKSKTKSELFYNKNDKQIIKQKKPINSAHIKKENISNNNYNSKNKLIKKSKSTNKIKNKIYNKIPFKNNNSNKKYEKIQKEINNKFIQDHPFKPIINKKYNKNKLNINETEEEKYHRLSRPKTYEIKRKQQIKTEDEKLNKINHIENKININKIKPEEVSNRLYKLHQQIKDKKEQVQKIFEEKQMNKFPFSPEINIYSKKIVSKNL